MNNKVICKECKEEKRECDFYKLVKENYCKDCINKKINYNNEKEFIKFLLKNDIMFIKKVYDKVRSISEYMKIISLNYSNKTFKDSEFEIQNDVNSDISFNENIVDFLKQEERSLRKKASKMLRIEDFPMYTKIINSYEKVVELIKDYDWQLKYSEYRLGNENGQKQVSVWEQNGDGQIKNHKIWNVEE